MFNKYPKSMRAKQLNNTENVNYIEHGNSDIYIFYTDEKLKGNNYDNKTIDSFDFKLNTVNNYCPNCKEKALGFKIKAFTD